MPGTLTDQEAAAVRLLTRLLKAEKAKRKEWDADNREILSYCRDGKTDRFYQEYAPDAFFQAQVSKTSEALDIFVPSIYSATPNRKVTPRPNASEMDRVRGKITEDYQNIALLETNADWHYNRCAETAVLTGRCVLWTGLDRKGLVCSKWVNTRDIGVDPDQDIPEQISWVYRRRRMKRFELLSRHPHEAERLKLTHSWRGSFSDEDDDDGDNSDKTHDVIEVYEFYFRVGLANFKGGRKAGDVREADDEEGETYDDEPCKYILVADPQSSDGGWLIRRAAEPDPEQALVATEPEFSLHHPWEIPFFMDGGWPCEWEDIRRDPETGLPCSVLKPGLGWQRALNFLYTLALGKSRTTLRDIIFLFEQGGIEFSESDKDEILNGTDLAVVMPKLRGLSEGNAYAEKLCDVLQFPEMKDTHLKLIELCEAQFAKATGLYELLYTGTTDTQIRTAADAQMKDRNSRSRLEQDAQKFEKFLSRVARKEAFAMRYLLDPEDVTKVVGQSGKDWGVLRSPEEFAQAEIQIRQEAQLRAQQMQMEMQAALDHAAKMGIEPPMLPPPEELEAQMEADIQAQLDAFGVRFESWIYQYCFDIEAGSARAKNRQWEIDSTNTLMQTVLPALMQAGAVGPGLLIIADNVAAIGRDDTAAVIRQFAEMAIQQMMAPPPPPAPEGQPPEQAPQEQPQHV